MVRVQSRDHRREHPCSSPDSSPDGSGEKATGTDFGIRGLEDDELAVVLLIAGVIGVGGVCLTSLAVFVNVDAPNALDAVD